jgi:hypothetical protein
VQPIIALSYVNFNQIHALQTPLRSRIKRPV